MKILFLDDDESRHQAFRKRSVGHDVTHVYYVKDAINALNKHRFDVASLDHDLGGKQYVLSGKGEETGYDVAEHIASMDSFKRPYNVIIHSYNQVGAANMFNVLKNMYGPKHLDRRPFGQWFPNKD